MFLNKLSWVLASVLAVSVLAGGVGVSARQVDDEGKRDGAAQVPTQPEPPHQKQARTEENATPSPELRILSDPSPRLPQIAGRSAHDPFARAVEYVSPSVLGAQLQQARELEAITKTLFQTGSVDARTMMEAQARVALLTAQAQDQEADLRDEASLLEAQLEAKRAELRREEIELDRAVESRQNREKFVQRKVMPESELQGAIRTEQVQEAQRDVKQAEVREAEIRLSRAQRHLRELQKIEIPREPTQEIEEIRQHTDDLGESGKHAPQQSNTAPTPSPDGAARMNVPVDDERMVVMAYPVADLIVPPDKMRNGRPVEGTTLNFAPLIELIQATVSPESWTLRGESSTRLDRDSPVGSITPFFLNVSLIVRQNPEGHEQLAEFLNKLRHLPRLQDSGLLYGSKLSAHPFDVP